MGKEKIQLQKPVSRYHDEHGFLSGELILAKDHLIFKPNRGFGPKKLIINLEDITLLEKVTDPVLKELIDVFTSPFGRISGIRYPPIARRSKKKGTFFHIKTRSKEGLETEEWFKIWEGGTEMFNGIKSKWQRIREI